MRAKAGGDRPLLLAACVTFSLSTLCVAGCSYDWKVDREQAVDASGADADFRPDVGVVEAGMDASPDTSAPVLDSGGVGSKDSGAPAQDAAADCAALTQALATARSEAISCNAMSLMPCLNTVKDECGCQVPVGGDPANMTTFENAVAAFEAGGCSTTSPVALCPGTCPTVAHVCLAVDGGASYACYP